MYIYIYMYIDMHICTYYRHIYMYIIMYIHVPLLRECCFTAKSVKTIKTIRKMVSFTDPPPNFAIFFNIVAKLLWKISFICF